MLNVIFKENKEPIHILRQLKTGLAILLGLAVVCELLFFPTLPNFYGCVMAIVSYVVFSYFLNEKYIRHYPFAFLMFLSMFMYRYLPIIATLAEGKPITFGFEYPYETFIYEIILFLLSALAFFLACRKSPKRRNNLVQKSLFRVQFFDITPPILWSVGLIGAMIRIYNFSAGEVQYGDVGGKLLIGLDYLMYAPLCLFFPTLLNLKYDNRKLLWLYAAFIFIINIASNSRQSIITPIATAFILLFLYLVLNNLKITSFISPIKMVLLGLFLIFTLQLLSNVSLAMLHTRHIREDVDKLELFQKTVKTMQDGALMKRLKAQKDNERSKLTSYTQGWTEYYVDNFMLDRYANVRITDETIYYAKKMGYANPRMQEMLGQSILALFPTPLLSFFGIRIDKGNLEFSRGDLIYGRAFGGYRVTSHVGDGLATFGHWYFPLQFAVFFIIFKLLNCFVYYSKKGIKYAPYALMNAFMMLGMFRNAQGIYGDIAYILRGFVQGVVTYLIIYHAVRWVLKLVNPEYVTNRKIDTEMESVVH